MADGRRKIDVGPGINQVSTVTGWYRVGQFANEDEARGAFKLAKQQGLDGMGTSIQAWMGLTDDEYDAWQRADELPPKKKPPKRKKAKPKAAAKPSSSRGK